MAVVLDLAAQGTRLEVREHRRQVRYVASRIALHAISPAGAQHE
jgi:hypothetical protein